MTTLCRGVPFLEWLQMYRHVAQHTNRYILASSNSFNYPVELIQHSRRFCGPIGHSAGEVSKL